MLRVRGGTPKVWFRVRRVSITAATFISLFFGHVESSSAATARKGSATGPPSVGMSAPRDAGALLSFNPVTVEVAGSKGFELRYRSYSTSGKPIEVTGVAFVPDRPAPTGGWPVLSYAHGTVGLADRCAPSKNVTSIETLLASTFNQLGVAVVQSDMEGLGTEGRHPYLVGISEGRGVVDAVRALRGVPQQTIAKKYVVWGHSQGGHAAIFAGQLASAWAPELDLRGVAAGAPPSQLGTVSDSLTNSPFRGYLLMVAAGMAQNYPQLDLSKVLTPRGKEVLPVVDTGCNSAVFAAVNKYPLDELIKVEGLQDTSWSKALRENEPGQTKVLAPVLIIHGDADEQVPFETSAALKKAMCAVGSNVTRKVYPGADHAGAALLSLFELTGWLKDRLDGRIASKGCR